jgi:hypothetical protein
MNKVYKKTKNTGKGCVMDLKILQAVKMECEVREIEDRAITVYNKESFKRYIGVSNGQNLLYTPIAPCDPHFQ